MARVEEDWWTRPRASKYLGISVSQFAATIAPRIDGANRKKVGKLDLFYGRAVVKAAIDRVIEAKGGGEKKQPDSLERMRSLRADREALSLNRELGRMIDVEQWRERYRGIFAALKRFGETGQRQFGREFTLAFNECMEELKSADVGIREDGIDARKSVVRGV